MSFIKIGGRPKETPDLIRAVAALNKTVQTNRDNFEYGEALAQSVTNKRFAPFKEELEKQTKLQENSLELTKGLSAHLGVNVPKGIGNQVQQAVAPTIASGSASQTILPVAKAQGPAQNIAPIPLGTIGPTPSIIPVPPAQAGPSQPQASGPSTTNISLAKSQDEIDIENEIDDIKKEIENLETKLKKANDDLNQLTDANAIKDKEDDIADIKDAINREKIKITDKLAEIVEVQKESYKKEKASLEIKLKKAYLEIKLQTQNKDLKRAESNLKSARKKKNVTQDTIDKHTANVAKLKQDEIDIENEIALLEQQIIAGAGLKKKKRMTKGRGMTEKDVFDRWDIVFGEIEAGNDGKRVIQEAHKLLELMMKNKMISKGEHKKLMNEIK
jgi:hypothetical protein